VGSPPPLHLTLAHAPTLLAQQRRDPPIPVAGMGLRQFPHPLLQLLLGRGRRSTTIPTTSIATTAGFGKRPARSTPRPPRSSAPVPVDAPGLEFFSHTASNTRFFNSDSAGIFLSSLFSRSSSFSRRASLTSSCPNCCFQRCKLTSEMLYSRQTSRIDLPASASRRIRIFSSVVYSSPFILSPFFWPQTNITSGSKKRGHVKCAACEYVLIVLKQSPISWY